MGFLRSASRHLCHCPSAAPAAPGSAHILALGSSTRCPTCLGESHSVSVPTIPTKLDSGWGPACLSLFTSCFMRSGSHRRPHISSKARGSAGSLQSSTQGDEATRTPLPQSTQVMWTERTETTPSERTVTMAIPKVSWAEVGEKNKMAK